MSFIGHAVYLDVLEQFLMVVVDQCPGQAEVPEPGTAQSLEGAMDEDRKVIVRNGLLHGCCSDSGGSLPVGDYVQQDLTLACQAVRRPLVRLPHDLSELDEDGRSVPSLILIDEFDILVPEVDVTDYPVTQRPYSLGQGIIDLLG